MDVTAATPWLTYPGDMKIARLSLQQGPRYGVYDEVKHDYIVLSDDPMFGDSTPTGQRIPATEANLVAPMLPRSKVIGFVGSYASDARLEDLGVFIKPNTAVSGPNDPLVIPAWADQVFIEPELAIVIGRPVKDIAPDRAHEAIFGFTLSNDATSTASGARAKMWDTSLPLGPIIDTALDTSSLDLVASINGEEVGRASTATLAFSPEELVAYASSLATLLPGDIISTGTPLRNCFVHAGDTAEVSLEGIGTLTNPVYKAE